MKRYAWTGMSLPGCSCKGLTSMEVFRGEQTVSVGIAEEVSGVCVTFKGTFICNGMPLQPGRYTVEPRPAAVLTDHSGRRIIEAETIVCIPCRSDDCRFVLEDILIGKGFHWERRQQQSFQGELCIRCSENGLLTVINTLPLEDYLKAVISSEMNPRAPREFLKAHAVISRSWLLCQLSRKKTAHPPRAGDTDLSFTDARKHTAFDVCADDHCQRYQGTGPVNASAAAALSATKGEVLMSGDLPCDTRFSKCCGGITERYASAWEDIDYPYLQPVADAPDENRQWQAPLASGRRAERFIKDSPAVFCNVQDRSFLQDILGSYDYETGNFFRWQVMIFQEELQGILEQKTGIVFGAVRSLRPLSRGASGRIYRLKVSGQKDERRFGKELVIRSILSPTHLYSSAFIVEPGPVRGGAPAWFRLRGAGWGHGVGLCQIGAAAMAAQGYDYRQILLHYFRGAAVRKLY